VFLVTELAVLYPGYPTIVPDLLAVMDVADPDRERNAWRVPDEGRGIDLVLEFRNLGKKHKDLVDNVKDYGKLGIAEYFALDCRTKVLRGWRLPSPTARTYTQRMPQGGVYPSGVLGLEVGMVEGRLRFFKDSALVPTTLEILGRVQRWPIRTRSGSKRPSASATTPSAGSGGRTSGFRSRAPAWPGYCWRPWRRGGSRSPKSSDVRWRPATTSIACFAGWRGRRPLRRLRMSCRREVRGGASPRNAALPSPAPLPYGSGTAVLAIAFDNSYARLSGASTLCPRALASPSAAAASA
jgi:hypothetical protein